MKIAVIAPSNIYCMPYYYKYESLFRDNNISFDLIFWDRSGVDEKTSKNVNQIKFSKKTTYNDERISKIFSFISFSKFVKKTIQQNKYDKLVFLGTYSLLTFFLTDFLTKYYKNNYILDVRDYTYEQHKWFFRKEEILIKNSYKVFISSEGYKQFLPQYNYLVFHNADFEIINKYLENKDLKEKSDRIRISFIGNVRYYEQNLKLLNCFKNDERFLLQYFGSGSNKLKEYCLSEGISNVKFVDRFNHSDTWKLYLETDVVNNLYGNSGIELTTALSNKLYFAASFEMPILVCKNTYMEQVSRQYNIGYTIDFENKNICDEFYKWYINRSTNDSYGWRFMKNVRNEESEVINVLLDYIKGEKKNV